MEKSTCFFYGQKNENGTVTARRGVIFTPRINSSGTRIKWYEDKIKTTK